MWLVPEVPAATLLVGDGSSWTVVTKYNKLGLGEDSLSPDASLMWFDEVVQDGDLYTYQAKVITTAGEPVFEGPPRSPDERLDWSHSSGPRLVASGFAATRPTRTPRVSPSINLGIPPACGFGSIEPVSRCNWRIRFTEEVGRCPAGC